MTTGELIELVKREFPGWTAEVNDQDDAWLWLNDGGKPKTAFVEITSTILCAVGRSGQHKHFAHADPLAALESATGETALSRREQAAQVANESAEALLPGRVYYSPLRLSDGAAPVLSASLVALGRDGEVVKASVSVLPVPVVGPDGDYTHGAIRLLDAVLRLRGGSAIPC